jgi:hypothetical protein
VQTEPFPTTSTSAARDSARPAAEHRDREHISGKGLQALAWNEKSVEILPALERQPADMPNTLSDRDLARALDAQIEAMHGVLASLEAERRPLARSDRALLLGLGRSDRFPRTRRGFSTDAGLGQRWQQVLSLTRAMPGFPRRETRHGMKI